MNVAMILFNRPIRGLFLQMARDPINVDNVDLHHQALETQQRKNDKSKGDL